MKVYQNEKGEYVVCASLIESTHNSLAILMCLALKLSQMEQKLDDLHRKYVGEK